MTKRPRAWALGLVGLTACTGSIGDDGGTDPGDHSSPTSFVCDATAVPESVPLRRLSRVQYQNTVHDLVRYAAPSDADAINGELAPLFDELPKDARIGPDKHYAGFTRLDQAVQQEHVDASYAIAVAAGKALTATPERLGTLAGDCAVDADATNDDACLDDFIRRFGERALRTSVSGEDVTFYRGPAGTAPFDAADYADVTALLMTAPQALYMVEHGDETDSSDFTDLGAYELAARLSYHFWQTMPDDDLLEAARSGTLLTEDGYAKEVDRIFADPRARDAVAEFFSNWLDNTTLEELDSRSGTPVFDAFAGDFTPGPDLREHMLAEVVDSATYYALDASGSFDDFFASDRSFAKTSDLASIYGVPVWDGTSEPPKFQDDAHAGLITRAAYVATGSANTRPIMKGVFLRKAVLCDDIAPPPPNAAANQPMLSETATTRQVVEGLTANQPCAGCHKVQINPLGFATENFDALGRIRAAQAVFDETTGDPAGSLPIDTTSTPHIDSGDDTASTGAKDVSLLMLESPKPHACFARQYFRFTFGREEDFDGDGCVLSAVKTSLDEGAPMSESLRAVAMSPAFRKRSFKESAQ